MLLKKKIKAKHRVSEEQRARDNFSQHAECFENAEDVHSRELQWYPGINSVMQIQFQDVQTFWEIDGTKIVCNFFCKLSSKKAANMQKQL